MDAETPIFKVLVADSLSESGLTPLREAPGIQVDIRTGLSPDELLAAIPEYDALLVRSSTTVTAQVIQAGKRLRVIARAGVGVDNIDVEAATQAGIVVVNAPTGNVVAAAEHTIAMLMALARHIPQADAHVRAGLWKRSQFMGVEVRDKVLGTVGLGRVAQEVVRRAQGLGMTCIAYDPYVSSEYAAQRSVRLVDLDTLLAEADFVTVHVPLTPQTHNLIDRAKLRLMKPTARILNVARGGVINEQDLVEAIEAGEIAGAALDVFEQEPLPPDSPLRRSDKIILTPHLGGSTIEAQEQVAEDVALQVIDVLNDRPARYAVNAPIIPPKDLEFLVPYIDLAERMGRFIQQVGGHGIGSVEITAHGHLADFDLAYVNAAALKGLLSDVLNIRINLVNATLLAERRGINLVERKKHQHEARYENMLTLRVTAGNDTWTLRGSVLQGEPYIVGINDLWVDFPATGNLLISAHQDRPGIIGRVGTILGQSDINISFMHVGRWAPRTEAIMVLGTDEVTPPALQAEIAALPHIRWLKAVTL
ncbi:phosphoglycerate dehydrogenase [Litorilinea aerophila]|uniref:D-3-phosphoglycerate dehydrogenase n=1 Tax=Litorilinea aerophila TaxID=1204385 RepID=A0A540VIQ3_9CHLR|nr:phosphoglycerate dehydrogenase [Litorilinea aerophila]MCC9076412.1 phosphoglycerate dehydrogenase [Litorilinea aerophila]GIV79102.1 MAG: D-3-phosphoglycerate dehydrogenase [Litorilinea sp.]